MSTVVTSRLCGRLSIIVFLLMIVSQPLLSHAQNGGDTTIVREDRNAFSQPAANMPTRAKLDFNVGRSFFRNPWVIAPSTTTARDGLGPLYNTNSCRGCHIRDGRGHPPLSNHSAVSMLLRLSIPATTEAEQQRLLIEGVIPEPHYGSQLQDFAIPDVAPEGQIRVEYREHTKTFADGETIVLREPIVNITQLGYGSLHPDVMISARIAPPMIGLGLLQAIPEETITAWAQQQAQQSQLDGSGIAGQINQVWDIIQQKTVLGRFGWKAGQPTLKQQNAAAFLGDMGLTSSLFGQRNCSIVQQACQRAAYGAQGKGPEVSDAILDFVTAYTHSVAVPAQRNTSNPTVIRGHQLFTQAHCHRCHMPQATTGESPFPWLAHQTIAPYTDLLLHDMGEGLADHRSEFTANGRQWRTPPLWGIGLTATVAEGHAYYLHDGRARNLMEAILWHGGEAQIASDAVLTMTKRDRDALIAFLQSL